MVEIDKRFGVPQAGAQVFASDYFAGALQQHRQHLKGLFLDADFGAVLAQLSERKICFESSETDNRSGRMGRIGGHTN